MKRASSPAAQVSSARPLCRHLVGDNGMAGRQRRQADLCRQSRARWRRSSGSPRYRFVQADICDRAAIDRGLRRAPVPTRSCIWPPKAMSTARSPARPTSSRPMSSARFVLLEAARAYWSGLPEPRARRASASFTSRPTRCSARSAPEAACSPRDTPYDPRSPYSASKAASDHLVRAWHRHLRPADRDHQLLEQLRAVSLSRKAHPADDPQRARRQAAAGLRRRRATCATGSMSRITPAALCARRSSAGGSARPTTSAARAERTTSTSSSAICDVLDRLRPDRHRAARAT